MNTQCFYCDDAITGKAIRHISFFHNENDREETLCPDCYKEWLEGNKD
ncbi:hypothetical protein [Radiobacillus sp. PE A8.2]